MTLYVVLFATTALGGCDADGRSLPQAWSTISLEQQPALFERRRTHPAPADMPDDLFLGQPHDAAKSALESSCPNTVRLDANLPTSDAFFVGCRLPSETRQKRTGKGLDALDSMRVGFWPKLDRRVATLEVKRDNVSPGVVWRRFQQVLDSEEEMLDRRWTGNILSASTEHYRLHADWDDGPDGPTHIVVGFAPDVSESVVE